MTNESKYRSLCAQDSSPLAFQTPQWLDAVAPNQWRVIVVTQGDRITAALPLVFNSKWGIKQTTLPPLTPYLGPVFFPPKDLAAKNLPAFKEKNLKQLVAQIPTTGRFITQGDFSFTNWLPFYWEGYQQTTRYSYILPAKNTKATTENFKPNILKDLQRGQSLEIHEGTSADTLFHIVQKESQRKKIPMHFNLPFLQRVFRKMRETQQLYILEAQRHGETIGAIAVVQDFHYAHYILGGVRVNNRNEGVITTLLWNAIQRAHNKGTSFNFEGSMHPGIGQYFKSFGASLTPYHQITKINHPLLAPFTKFRY